MKYLHLIFFFELFIGTNLTLLDINELKNTLFQWKNQNLLNFSEIGALPNGLLDLSNIKNKLLEWKNNKLNALCPSNAARLQTLLNVVCSTAQPTNTTARDSCISCFLRVTSLPEGPQELNGLSTCATRYFTNTSYSVCAVSLQTLASSALNVQTTGCYMGYCDLVRCLRRVNSNNLIIQCTREARTGINITLDADNVKFFINVTSCILAKTRCETYNPITGEPQTPGYTPTNPNIRVSNALQISSNGDLRVIAFAANTPAISSFCSSSSSSTNLNLTSWLTNIC